MMMTKEIRDDQSGQTDFDLDGIERALARKNIPIVLGTELVIAKATILTDIQPVKTDAYTRLTHHRLPPQQSHGRQIQHSHHR